MGYRLSAKALDAALDELSSRYTIFAPKRFEMGGHFSDTDQIRYGKIHTIAQVAFAEKSTHTFKEALLPICQTLFYFTEEQIKEAAPPEKEIVVFLRSCDRHAVKRLDEIYLCNGPVDSYYKRVREHMHFVLIGCPKPFENCFCVDMGTNQTDEYDLSIQPDGDGYLLDCKNGAWEMVFSRHGAESTAVSPAFVTETPVHVNIPDALTAQVTNSKTWDTYDSRCINCGRCNFSCPTCTCYTMQDIFYTENGRTGERRRVWASCMVDTFTDVAGGGCYRQKNGQRMRFKVLHKVLDYKQRFGDHMCVGCGRCDDACPEYISFSGAINSLEGMMQEVTQNGAK